MHGLASGHAMTLAKLVAGAAVAAALAACGGGGGGIGTRINSISPPPPVTPAVTISAPAAATTPTGVAPVTATEDGPSFTSGPASGTVFPLLQTAMTYGDRRAGPDAAVNAAGGTATATDGTLSINVAGAPMPSFAASNLDWTMTGWWGNGPQPDAQPDRGLFVAGYETPAGEVPSTGTATYRGSASGFVIAPLPPNTIGGFACGCTETNLSGTATFTADFGARVVSGSLTNMVAGAFDDPWEGTFAGEPWNDVAFTSAITGSGFSGTTSVSSVPGQPLSLSASATGTIEGRFFGPVAQEAGAVWTLFDGSKAAVGTLSGKRP